jgi:hypothetical protein
LNQQTAEIWRVCWANEPGPRKRRSSFFAARGLLILLLLKLYHIVSSIDCCLLLHSDIKSAQNHTKLIASKNKSVLSPDKLIC